LRIAVNDELGALDRLLDAGPKLLRPGGRMAVLSYHSLEDRRVKTAFKALASGGGYERMGPLKPSEREVRENPRSRSARLRAIARTR
ncbi:MAG: 16S rRNA (cytosine(1402)-N(4))-methyltransferase, partial [Planctomycetota bacterium]|nr:16S rRNA (cytosine(1402)-N(4))-methyltransferase [Planctomycetota bacterium]